MAFTIRSSYEGVRFGVIEDLLRLGVELQGTLAGPGQEVAQMGQNGCGQ